MRIELTDPDLLPFEALKLLQSSLDKPPKNDTKIWEYLECARNDQGTFFVLYDEDVQGVFYFELFDGVLNLPMMAFKDGKKYKDTISDFIKSLMRRLKVETFCIVSRGGWHRFFKDLEPIGTLYTYRQPLGESDYTAQEHND